VSSRTSLGDPVVEVAHDHDVVALAKAFVDAASNPFCLTEQHSTAASVFAFPVHQIRRVEDAF
jgi:hypothetical protein